ncbi:MAG: IclR family transcriptional regulator [Kiloniellaceae bacterium]
MAKPTAAKSRSARVLELLELVARMDRPASVQEITELSGLPKATAYRICSTLESDGYLRKELGGRGLVAGPRLLALAQSLIGGSSLATARHAILASAARRIGETCNLSIPKDGEMIYLDRVESEWPLRLQLPIGTKVPLHCTASGKLFLATLSPAPRSAVLRSLTLEARAAKSITDPAALNAALDVIRKTQVGTDDEEFLEGMIAIAVPVTDAAGRFYAALAVHAPVLRMSLEQAMAHVPILREAAAQLAELGASDPAEVDV